MEPEKQTPNPYVPQELRIQVLLRLPVKSLVRFLCVSKTWQSLIKDSTFSRQKLNLSHESAADKQRLLIRRFMLDDPEPTLTMHEDNENFCQNYVDLEIPPPLSAKQKERPASMRHSKWYISDGELLCVYNYGAFILWNPSINKTVLVPTRRFDEKTPPLFWVMSVRSYGFGFDIKTNDYKVFRIGYPRTLVPKFDLKSTLKTGKFDLKSTLKTAQIFSLRRGCWRDIVGELPQYPFTHISLCFCGSIYWIIKHGNGESVNWILAFDLGAEEFVKIANLPHILAYEDEPKLRLLVFKDSISLFQNSDGKDNICSLWVMKEKDVWIKMWTYGPAMVRPLGFRLNGELLVEVSEKYYSEGGLCSLSSLDLKTQELRNLGIYGYEFKVDTYVENLWGALLLSDY